MLQTGRVKSKVLFCVRCPVSVWGVRRGRLTEICEQNADDHYNRTTHMPDKTYSTTTAVARQLYASNSADTAARPWINDTSIPIPEKDWLWSGDAPRLQLPRKQKLSMVGNRRPSVHQVQQKGLAAGRTRAAAFLSTRCPCSRQTSDSPWLKALLKGANHRTSAAPMPSA